MSCHAKFFFFWGGKGFGDRIGDRITSFLLSSQLLQNLFQLRNLGFASDKKVDVPILLRIICLNNAE